MIEITEGGTKILVPDTAISSTVPPRNPAFFNPRARANRDYSIIAYGAFAKNFVDPKVMIDSMSGVGARGLRVANEIPGMHVVVNDLNPYAISLAQESASINTLKNFETSQAETCSCLARYYARGTRAAIVDIDPFGSPAKYMECALRATAHGGLLSATATDMQVLHGIFPAACRRRYGGTPIRAEFGDEVAIRLILGCLRSIAARLDLCVSPVCVERDMHYYRVYARVFKKIDTATNLGFVFYCRSCGSRGSSEDMRDICNECSSRVENAGPLWTGLLFDAGFVKSMLEYCNNVSFDTALYKKMLEKSLAEADFGGTYYTLDEMASRAHGSPPKISEVVEGLQELGFAASQTSFKPTGFRTDADIGNIMGFFLSRSRIRDKQDTSHC